MALLKMKMHMHDLRNDVPTKLLAQSEFTTMMAGARALASESLHLVTSMAPLEAQSRLQIAMAVGANPPAGGGDFGSIDPAGTDGFAELLVCAVVDDDLAYNHTSPDGAAFAFVDAVHSGLGGIFASLPDPEAFLESIGIDGFASIADHITVGTEVVLFG